MPEDGTDISDLATVIQIADEKEDYETVENAALEILGEARYRKGDRQSTDTDPQEAQP